MRNSFWLGCHCFYASFSFFFLNHFSDLRSLMQFMNLQKKNVNGNQMRRMKFRLVPTLVCFYTLEIFYYKIDGELTTIRTDEPLLTLVPSVPKFVFPLHFLVFKFYRLCKLFLWTWWHAKDCSWFFHMVKWRLLSDLPTINKWQGCDTNTVFCYMTLFPQHCYFNVGW